MRPRKVKRGGTVYEMRARPNRGRTTVPEPEKHAGRAHPSCKLCGGRGWLSKGQFEACTQHELQELGRLQSQQAVERIT